LKILYKENKISIFYSQIIFFICVASISPFVFSNAIAYYPGTIMALASLLIMTGFLVTKNNIKIGDKYILGIVLAQVLFSLVYALFHDDVLYITVGIHSILFLIVFLFVVNFIGIKMIARPLLAMFVIIGCLAILAVILSLSGVLSPISSFYNPDGRVSYNYILTFSNAVFDFEGFSIVRPAGFFDEPGKLALYITYALIINKLLNWSKKAEWVFIIAGLFTMSLAFFITLAFYLVFFYLNKKKFISFIIIISIFSSGAVYLINNKDSTEKLSALYKYTLLRIELSDDEDKIIKGDSRTKLVNEALQVFSENKIFGYGRSKSIIDYESLSGNIIAPLAVDGIIGLFFIYLPVFYMLIKSVQPYRSMKNYKKYFNFIAIKSVLIISMQYLQRPSISSLLDYILIIIMIYAIVRNSENQSRVRDNSL
jgi:hypothetical protein